MSAPQIIIASLASITMAASFMSWLSLVRPYIHKKKGYKNGLNWGYAMWSDWDEAYGLAKNSGDTGTKVLCIANFAFVILWIAAFVSMPILAD